MTYCHPYGHWLARSSQGNLVLGISCCSWCGRKVNLEDLRKWKIEKEQYLRERAIAGKKA